VSERAEGGRGGFGPFLLGLGVGAVLGFLFAPEAGSATRTKLTKKLRGLKELAAEAAGEVVERVTGGEDDEPEPVALAPSAREELERRLAEARRRRRSGRAARGGATPTPDAFAEEDEPVA